MSAAEPRRSARLEEVARAAGVSKSTVSRVVNGEPYVSSKAREAVREAIARLGYSPNQAARALAGSQANSIALVLGEPDVDVADLVRGVHAELAGRRVQVLLTVLGEDLVNELRGGHVDGVLLIGAEPRLLAGTGLPVVVVGRPLDGGVPYVDFDNVDGALVAARHLVAAGRTRIATIAAPRAVGVDRVAGWRRGVGHLPDDLVAYGDLSPESGAAAMEELLLREPALDAVFAAGDAMALGALQVLHARGRRVPEDVAVVGFGDAPFAAGASPPLTTVRRDVELLGRTAAWRLMAEVAGEERLPPFLALPTSLVVRRSA
ncbi:LacI family DNA-binding transcriptional regulator [Saccharothrix obliqua]|uniref:LacI family DNA-binding transcriptional regulator n=1 Tax=Saccharothrix obliqua TaxID=2861747 RepID=UPI001C5D5DBE|nr:LacI family DNA-binding transcriptional regulator [Saccharothrix obliqua]MBW4716954.1 LacI family transcriptional regulator [Saccharothrix obliqua]